MVDKINVTRTSTVALDKLVIIWGSFVFCIAGQHALDAHADTFSTLDRTPALVAEQVEADDSVRVYVWVHGDVTVWP